MKNEAVEHAKAVLKAHEYHGLPGSFEANAQRMIDAY